MFVSINGKAKEVKEIFAGGTDGLAHKINEVFGSVNGTAKLVYSSTPKEHNAFNDFTWAEIKQLADEGRLLEHFNLYDKVNIKLTQPLVGKDHSGNVAFYQDTLTMIVTKLSETGMRLVSYTATPGRFIFRYDNSDYVSDFEASTSYKASTPSNAWGMCNSLYTQIKKIDNALPSDLREVLTDFAPLYKYEYYYDEENKRRLRKEYDDCRVRQVTECGYKYHQEFVEENNRNEYILDVSCSAKSEGVYKKFIPLNLRSSYDKCYGVSHGTYKKTDNSWQYTLIFNDPTVAWNWDWENYDNVNKLSLINNPEYTTYSPDVSNIIPEVQIGEIAETL